MSSITLPLTAQPLLSIGAPAAFLGNEIVWDASATEPVLGAAKGEDAVRAELNKAAPAAGPALPSLPTEFGAKTPFVEVSPILDALDDYLAYRYVVIVRKVAYKQYLLCRLQVWLQRCADLGYHPL